MRRLSDTIECVAVPLRIRTDHSIIVRALEHQTLRSFDVAKKIINVKFPIKFPGKLHNVRNSCAVIRTYMAIELDMHPENKDKN